MVVPVRQFLHRAGVPYTYVNIHANDEARARVRQFNAGNETVPTLVFGDGTVLREPRVEQIHAKLREGGVHVPAWEAFVTQHSLWMVVIAFLLFGAVVGRLVEAPVLGGVVGLIAGFLVNTIYMRRAGS
jgi:mycoredoxin